MHAQHIINAAECFSQDTCRTVKAALPSIGLRSLSSMLHRMQTGMLCPQALADVLPVVSQQKLDAGGYMILRPDSGDPVECVLMALRYCT